MSEAEAVRKLPLFSGAPSKDVDKTDVLLEYGLIEKVRKGDGEAFRELYKIYAPTINGVVLARVPRDEVQDIVQEVFLAAYRNLDSLRDSRVFGPWLVKIARNRAAEFYRKHKPSEELNEQIREVDNKRTEAAEVLTAIRSLNEAYRETLMLRLVEGMSAKEIAERTGLKPESVRVNLHRGMEMLRQNLGINQSKR